MKKPLMGYCLNFYRYHHINNGKFSMNQTAFSSLTSELKYDILLGEFDVLLSNPVYAFEDYRNVSEFSKTWIGGRQTLNLFLLDNKEQISQKHTRINTNEEVHFGKEKYIDFTYPPSLKNKKANEKASFTVITCLNIANDIKFFKRFEYNDFLKEIRTEILKNIDKYNAAVSINKKVACEVYGCLGSTEIVIVWLAETFSIVPTLVDKIRNSLIKIYNEENLTVYKNENVFSTSFCFVLFDLRKAEFAEDERAEIQITENNNPVKKDLDNFISKHGGVAQCIGEFEYIVNLPANCLKSDVFDGCNKENLARPWYFQDILQHNVRLTYIQDKDGMKHFDSLNFCDIIPKEEDMEIIFNNSAEKLIENATPEKGISRVHTVRNLHDTLITTLQDVDFINHELIHTLESLLCDYFRCMSISMNDLWYIDFTVQYKSFLEQMTILTEYYYKYKENAYPEKFGIKLVAYSEYLDRLVTLMVQQIYHQSQANQLVINVPNSHQRYTGQHDLILHAYYGIVKHLLEIIYKTTGRSQFQSEIHPFITVNTIPRIVSHLYFELSEAQSDENLSSIKNLGKRIIEFNLPNDALFHVSEYIPFIIHEIFHYCSPYDRSLRNTLFGVFAISYYEKRFLFKYIQSIINKEITEELKIDKERSDIIIKWFIERIFPQVVVYTIQSCIYTDYVNSCFLWSDLTNKIKSDINFVAKSEENKVNLFIDNLLKAIDLFKRRNDINDLKINFFSLIDDEIILGKIWNDVVVSENNELKDSLRQIFSKVGVYESILNEYKAIIEDDLREVFPDLAMIIICHMTPAEYFLYLKKIDFSSLEAMSKSKIFRIGTICYWFIEYKNRKLFSDEPGGSKEEFSNLYLQTFLNDKLKETSEAEAHIYWEDFTLIYKKFCNYFADFIPIIDSILRSMIEHGNIINCEQNIAILSEVW